jgi:uncharacterized protein with GYD domain
MGGAISDLRADSNRAHTSPERREQMPKYLVSASYTAEGTKGLLKDGGSKRKAFIKGLIEKLGGKLEAFYFAFGDHDIYLIIEMPDAATASALSLNVAATGAVQLTTTVLLSPEEIDAAVKKPVDYRPPGK